MTFRYRLPVEKQAFLKGKWDDNGKVWVGPCNNLPKRIDDQDTSLTEFISETNTVVLVFGKGLDTSGRPTGENTLVCPSDDNDPNFVSDVPNNIYVHGKFLNGIVQNDPIVALFFTGFLTQEFLKTNRLLFELPPDLKMAIEKTNPVGQNGSWWVNNLSKFPTQSNSTHLLANYRLDQLFPQNVNGSLFPVGKVENLVFVQNNDEIQTNRPDSLQLHDDPYRLVNSVIVASIARFFLNWRR